MLNKLCSFIKKYNMLQPGDHVVCAVSGGADSVALLFAMWLLRDKLGITVSCAHFNHQLRGQESDRDEAFVREFCQMYDIELVVGSAQIVPGKKGLEAAARDARYSFLKQQSGKIATAHTANDNGETLLMHLVRGTGLKGLGAIAPVNDRLIRPMLGITRQQVLDFLEQYNLSYVTDSSNETDAFLRNRMRHHVMPVLEKENPSLAENLSALALRLREDEKILDAIAVAQFTDYVPDLREMPAALRNRILSRYLEENGVREPEAEHIALLDSLVFSDNPSAKASFPCGVTICRNYDRLEKLKENAYIPERELPCPGVVEISELGLRITCAPAETIDQKIESFVVAPVGTMVLRWKQPGDKIRLSGGTKSLKKLFVDSKVPVQQRMQIPVIADDKGILAVCGFGANLDRMATTLPAIQITVEKI